MKKRANVYLDFVTIKKLINYACTIYFVNLPVRERKFSIKGRFINGQFFLFPVF